MRPRGLTVVLAGICVILAGWNRRAEAGCDPATATAQRARIERLLADQDHRAHVWDLAWGLGYAGTTAGQVVFALRPEWVPIINVNDNMQKSLWVGAVKSALGSGSHFVLPLRVEHPHITAGMDPCSALAEAERALAVTAGREKRSFWLNHIGGLLANLGGTLVLGLGYHAWATAALSFAIGYPVGLITTYTMPRGAWHAHRNRSWAVGVTATPLIAPGMRGLAISGWF